MLGGTFVLTTTWWVQATITGATLHPGWKLLSMATGAVVFGPQLRAGYDRVRSRGGGPSTVAAPVATPMTRPAPVIAQPQPEPAPAIAQPQPEPAAAPRAEPTPPPTPRPQPEPAVAHTELAIADFEPAAARQAEPAPTTQPEPTVADFEFAIADFEPAAASRAELEHAPARPPDPAAADLESAAAAAPPDADERRARVPEPAAAPRAEPTPPSAPHYLPAVAIARPPEPTAASTPRREPATIAAAASAAAAAAAAASAAAASAAEAASAAASAAAAAAAAAAAVAAAATSSTPPNVTAWEVWAEDHPAEADHAEAWLEAQLDRRSLQAAPAALAERPSMIDDLTFGVLESALAGTRGVPHVPRGRRRNPLSTQLPARLSGHTIPETSGGEREAPLPRRTSGTQRSGDEPRPSVSES